MGNCICIAVSQGGTSPELATLAFRAYFLRCQQSIPVVDGVCNGPRSCFNCRMGTRSDYLRLMRISLLPTAWSNVLMGFAVQAMPTPTPRMWFALPLILLCSGCLYVAGMVMNDLCDFHTDCQTRPERVLPSGKIALQQARHLVWGLAIAGILAALLTTLILGKGSMAVLVIAMVLLALICWYNQLAKHTVLGPLAMGLCRTANVLLGSSLALSANHPSQIRPATLFFAIGMGLYVAGITWFARDEHHSSSRSSLLGGGSVMLLAIGLMATYPWLNIATQESVAYAGAGMFAGLLAMMVLPVFRNVARALVSTHATAVKKAVITSLLTIIMIDATICYLVSPTTPAYALCVASLLLPAFLMSRRVMAT